MVGMRPVQLKAGQFIYGRVKAAEKTGLSQQTCRTCLNTLKKLKKLTTESTNKYTIITIVNWDTYNTPEEDTNQQNNQQVTSSQPASNQQLTTDKKERKKEGKNITTDSLDRESSGEIPPDVPKASKCPQAKIKTLYHQKLPELPPMAEWGTQSEANLRARWRSNAEYQNLDWWSWLFDRVQESDFLMGRVKDFQADLGWIVRAANFQKIVNGFYKNRSPRTGSALGDNNARACQEFLNGG